SPAGATWRASCARNSAAARSRATACSVPGRSRRCIARSSATIHGSRGGGLGCMGRWHGRWHSLEPPGDWGGFASLLFLLPEADLGFFLSYNIDDLLLRERFLEAFLEPYFPVEHRLPPELPAGSGERIRRAQGWYGSNRSSRDELTKMLAIPLRVDAAGPGALRLVVPGGFVDPIELREVAPWRFARADGDEAAVFDARSEGPPSTLFLAAFGVPFAFDRLPRWPGPPRPARGRRA